MEVVRDYINSKDKINVFIHKLLIRIKIREKWTGIYFTIFFHFHSAMCIRIVMNNSVNIEYTDSIKRSSEKERGFVGPRTRYKYLSVWFPVRSITCKSFYILMIMLLCHIHKYFSRKNHYMSFFVNCWRLGPFLGVLGADITTTSVPTPSIVGANYMLYCVKTCSLEQI